MKKEVNPVIAVIVIVIVILVLGGIYYYLNRPQGGSLPTPAQAQQGRRVGGKILPGAAGGPGKPQ
ncbi:MAG TPA: hypothetical protein VKV29_02505 [Chthonomonas sp.]|jgi:FlaG/FlaF family flagellin (archaellin)|uniref:hypothetical protein n=1 Tax=Chthonomonas sp. TaxID=2282153 RepID=UPI002B4B90EB|nr:hypothetical protein [Chthonomonas sp.]HLH79137.1 hypothetical protein [Chthonomonas sp.]